MSKVADCQKLLIAESEKKGFLTFDDIMDMSDTYSLSVSEVDQLSEALEIRGIIIYETAPIGKDVDHFEDYSRIDYEAIFKEIISLSPDLEYVVELIRQLPPPQYGEISALTMQTAAGNAYARERLILIHLRVALKIALSMAKRRALSLHSCRGRSQKSGKTDPYGSAARTSCDREPAALCGKCL